MASLFTNIVNGHIPAHKILEDERYLAFLDIRPIAEGHTLVIPKKEIDYFFDLDITLARDQILEGMAREDVNRVQKLHKTAGLQLDDPIPVK